MAQLVVRQLEEEVVQVLKERAAKNGHSAEEEHRVILREALSGLENPEYEASEKYKGMDFKTFLMSCPEIGDLEIPPRNGVRERPDPFAS